MVQLLSEWVIGNESRFPTMAALSVETFRRIQISLKFGLQHFDKVRMHSVFSFLMSCADLS